MPIRTNFFPYTLHFTFDAGTSRGILREKTSWLIRLQDPESESVGWGEAGPLAGLSVDYNADFPGEFDRIAEELSMRSLPADNSDALSLAAELVPENLPSLRFALEMALLQLINQDGPLLDPGQFLTEKEFPLTD